MRQSCPSRLPRVCAALVLGTSLALGASLAAWPTPTAFGAGPSVRATEPSPAGEPEVRVGGRFILTTHDGKTVTDEHFRGRHLLVFFGYTHCPDICPTSLQSVAAAIDLLGPAGEKVQPLFISLDPERDNQALLAQYVTNFHPRMIGLRGPLSMIDRVAQSYRVKSEREPTPGGAADNYTINHTAAVFHMGPDGVYIGRFGHETPPEEMAARLRAAIGP